MNELVYIFECYIQLLSSLYIYIYIYISASITPLAATAENDICIHSSLSEHKLQLYRWTRIGRESLPPLVVKICIRMDMDVVQASHRIAGHVLDLIVAERKFGFQRSSARRVT